MNRIANRESYLLTTSISVFALPLWKYGGRPLSPATFMWVMGRAEARPVWNHGLAERHRGRNLIWKGF